MAVDNARSAPGSADRTLAKIRRLVLALVALGLAGTAVELTLMAHTEDTLQLVPFAALAASFVAVSWWLLSPRGAAVTAVQLTMGVMIVTGLVGVAMHYQANMEFQLEMDKSLAGWDLIMKVLEAKAPPALAPGNMALLGLIGLAAVYRDRVGG